MDKIIIDNLLNTMEGFRRALLNFRTAVEKMQVPDATPEEKALKEFTELRMLLNSPKWPVALESSLICNDTEEDKNIRAEGILEVFVERSLEGISFLDFGCGDGHIAKKASEKAKLSIGYDIKSTSSFNWETQENNLLLTTDFEKVKSLGPYDVILLYDVLDHVPTEAQLDILIKAKQMMTTNSKLIIRFHPWCSRHGGHLYKQINKAFVHVIFTEDELIKMGYKPEQINKVIYPVKTYDDLIAQVGFKKSNPIIEKSTPIEKIFKEFPYLKGRIYKIWEAQKEFPEFQTSISFIDYILEI